MSLGFGTRSSDEVAVSYTICAVNGCEKLADPPHHIWSGNGNRVDCMFQSTRKSGTPGDQIHRNPDCKCNTMPLCFYHHRRAHARGDEWFYDATKDFRVGQKLWLVGK